jgi:aminoglycoside/choline kinase family phosphotransferase
LISKDLVNGKNLMQYKIKKISGDASFREFYKIEKNSKFTILVKANKDKFRNLIIYAAINELLIKNKIRAPKLVQEYFAKNMMEIENLGSHSFLEHIKKKKKKFNDYKKLIELVIKLQKINFKKNIKFKNNKIRVKKYNLSELHKESDLFFDWYLKNNSKKKEFTKNKTKIKKELNVLYKKLYFQEMCFVHRDFHASNIMVKNKKFGLIDSQDALRGNLLYDVVSLIDDVRIRLPIKLKSSLFSYYLSKTSKIKKKTEKLLAQNDFDILSVQRNLKILGIFVRLFKRDHKLNYLKYLPYVWELLELRLKNPIFVNLKYLLNKAVPKKKRKKVNFNDN